MLKRDERAACHPQPVPAQIEYSLVGTIVQVKDALVRKVMKKRR
jgi:hypothetical protein